MVVMIFLHTEQSVPGRVAATLSQLGHQVVLARPILGERLPVELDQVDGLVIMGGPMSVHDSEMRPEQRLVEQFLALGRPFLGICLGAQLLNLIQGGLVSRCPDGKVQMGWHPLQGLTDRYRPITSAYQWHSEWITPASAFDVTALDPEGRVQGIEAGQHWGVQFHPEADYDVRARWLARASHKLVGPGARPEDTHQVDGVRFDPPMERWLRSYLSDWLAQSG